MLSDGRHNKPGFGPGGIYTSDQGSNNLDLICAEAKDEQVLIITVAYELDDDEGKEQLENCASDSQYYLEGTEDNIATVFEGHRRAPDQGSLSQQIAPANNARQPNGRSGPPLRLLSVRVLMRTRVS